MARGVCGRGVLAASPVDLTGKSIVGRPGVDKSGGPVGATGKTAHKRPENTPTGS